MRMKIYAEDKLNRFDKEYPQYNSTHRWFFGDLVGSYVMVDIAGTSVSGSARCMMMEPWPEPVYKKIRVDVGRDLWIEFKDDVLAEIAEAKVEIAKMEALLK